MKVYVSEDTFIIKYRGLYYEFLNNALNRLEFLKAAIMEAPLNYYTVSPDSVKWSDFREVN